MPLDADKTNQEANQVKVVTSQDLPKQDLAPVHSEHAAQALVKEVTHKEKTSLKDEFLLWLSKNPKIKKALMWVGVGIMVIVFLVLFWVINTSGRKRVNIDTKPKQPQFWQGDYQLE